MHGTQWAGLSIYANRSGTSFSQVFCCWSPFTSRFDAFDTTKCFILQILCSQIFFVFLLYCPNSRGCCVWKPRGSAASQTLKPALLLSKTMLCFKSQSLQFSLIIRLIKLSICICKIVCIVMLPHNWLIE